MSRRSQARRRRSYGRRQHEVRERRPGSPDEFESLAPDQEFDWHPSELGDERGRRASGTIGGLSQ